MDASKVSQVDESPAGLGRGYGMTLKEIKARLNGFFGSTAARRRSRNQPWATSRAARDRISHGDTENTES